MIGSNQLPVFGIVGLGSIEIRGSTCSRSGFHDSTELEPSWSLGRIVSEPHRDQS